MSWQTDSTTGEPTSDIDATEHVGLPAPARPLTVVFGSAVLVVGGLFGVVQKVLNPLVAPAELAGVGVAFAYVLLLGLDVLSIVAGVLLRRGQTWILAANVAAVYAFIHLAIVTLTGVIFSAIYLAVVVACFVARDWFEAMRAWRVARFEARLTR